MLTQVFKTIVRHKMTKVQAYRYPGNTGTHTRGVMQRPHIGVKALSAEHVDKGHLLVKQRKFIAKNPNVTRHRHFKLYPGVNVRVNTRTTSLHAECQGRLKLTHDVTRDVMLVNVLPEPRAELLREDCWRYRTEHVTDLQDNHELCWLRTKASFIEDREFKGRPEGIRPLKKRISDHNDIWKNAHVRDPLEMEPYPFALTGYLLRRHLKKCQKELEGEANPDPDFEVRDRLFEEKLKGHSI